MFRTRQPRGPRTPGVPRSPRRGAPRARLRVEALEPLIAPAAVPLLAIATDQASGPRVRVFNRDLSTRFDFFAYDTRFTGGVHVATGDVNGDGLEDIITAPGPNGGPDVKVWDGLTGNMIFEFNAYDPGFRGGVWVAAADVNGDGRADVVTGAGPGGGPHVQVFDGTKLGLLTAGNQLDPSARLASFFPYATGFGGGVTVAAGDTNKDGKADLVTGAGPGGGPHVRVFDATGVIGNPSLTPDSVQSFFAFPSGFRGGVFVAAGITRGNGVADIIAGAGAGGGPNVAVYDGSTGSNGTLLRSYFPYDARFSGGVRVAAFDFNNDGRDDVVSGPGTNGGPDIRIVDTVTLTQLAQFNAFSPDFLGGVFVG